ncbi:hypothetical protein ACH5RR_038427 [Cinchona calisaya]|uniref:Uncharacterized protein n=1 Tax=Cinchona calisaya TaxID=153742 RepID=A0ABD2XV94_9GENT
MVIDQKFQQRWEYRMKDDEVDSSSDDSKSSLGDEPFRKKHKLVASNLSVPTLSSQQNSQVDVTKYVHSEIADVKTKKHIEPRKKKSPVGKKSERNYGETRKRKVNNPIQDQEPALLNDLKIFSESLLKDLKVAKEKMLVQMKKQMTNLVAAKPVSRQRRSICVKKSDGAMHQNGNKSSTKVQSCDGRLKKVSTKNNQGFDSIKCSKAKGETLSLPGNEPLHLVKYSDQNQIGCSSYLTLPAVLPKPHTESLSTDTSLYDHIDCGFPVNNANNAERENSMADANNHYSYLLGIQSDEQFGSFAQITSQNTGFWDGHCSHISSLISGLPVGYSITSQRALNNPAQESNTRSLRMIGGSIEVPGRSQAHSLSECFVANTISSNMNHSTANTDGKLVSFNSGEVEKRSSRV